MKVEAYRCDVPGCGDIVAEISIVGIDPTEDLFDRLCSFPTVMNARKTNIHYCVFCYRKKVLNMAEKTVNRKKDEAGYKLAVKELAFSLRNSAVQHFKFPSKFGVSKKK